MRGSCQLASDFHDQWHLAAQSCIERPIRDVDRAYAPWTCPRFVWGKRLSRAIDNAPCACARSRRALASSWHGRRRLSSRVPCGSRLCMFDTTFVVVVGTLLCRTRHLLWGWVGRTRRPPAATATTPATTGGSPTACTAGPTPSRCKTMKVGCRWWPRVSCGGGGRCQRVRNLGYRGADLIDRGWVRMGMDLYKPLKESVRSATCPHPHLVIFAKGRVDA